MKPKEGAISKLKKPSTQVQRKSGIPVKQVKIVDELR